MNDTFGSKSLTVSSLITKQPTTPGLAPRTEVGCESFITPSSANYDCDEGCDGAASDLCYYSIARKRVPVYSFVHEFWQFVTPRPSASLGQVGQGQRADLLSVTGCGRIGEVEEQKIRQFG